MPKTKTLFLSVSLVFLALLNGCALLPYFQDGPANDREGLSPEAAAMDVNPDEVQSRRAEQAEAQAEQEALEYARIQRALASRDLVLGMGMSEVRSVWGEPRDVQTAGNPGSGNEKWIYFNGLSSRWSMSSARVVYFERGLVAGWDTYRP